MMGLQEDRGDPIILSKMEGPTIVEVGGWIGCGESFMYIYFVIPSFFHRPPPTKIDYLCHREMSRTITHRMPFTCPPNGGFGVLIENDPYNNCYTKVQDTPKELTFAGASPPQPN